MKLLGNDNKRSFMPILQLLPKKEKARGGGLPRREAPLQASQPPSPTLLLLQAAHALLL